MPAKHVRFSPSYQPYTQVVDNPKAHIQDQIEISNAETYRGSFGEVYRGEWEGQAVAVRKLRGNKNDELFNQEVAIWRDLHHPNIVPFLGVISYDLSPTPSTDIFMPQYLNGNLNEYVAENANADNKALLTSLSHGMEYLHSKDLVHGDLRGENIFVNDSGQCVISDFGISKAFPSPAIGLGSHVEGYLRWQAPECVLSTSGQDFSTASDVWSFGCIAGQLYTGRVPFGNIHNDVGIVLAQHRRRRPFDLGSNDTRCGPGPGRHRDQGIWRLSLYCTQYDRHKRPTAAIVSAWLLGTEDTANFEERWHGYPARL